MSLLSKYTKFIPYLYFIAITAYWFTSVNRNGGISAYPILLLALPFLWQLIRPNDRLNFTLGITFVCLSSYLILAYLFDLLNIVNLSHKFKNYLLLGGVSALAHFVMSLWMIRNSIRKSF